MDRGSRPLTRLLAALHVLAVALAAGSLLFFGAMVAPAAFAVLPSKNLAGDLIARVLTDLCRLEEICAAVLFFTVWRLTKPVHGRKLFVIARRLPILAFFCPFVTERLIIPAMDKMRLSSPLGALPAAFIRYHTLSVIFLTAGLLCVLAILLMTPVFLEAPAPTPAPPAPPLPAFKI